MIPYYPLEDNKVTYPNSTYWEHLVSEYVGISMIEVENLNYLDYLRYRRDAFINKANQSEKGQEYLEKAYRLEQTKPDRKALRNRFGKEGVING